MINFDKTFLIFGCGITGQSAVLFCKRHNLKFYITDDDEEKLKNIKIKDEALEEKYKIYHYDEEKLKNIDYLLLSPSIHCQYNPHNIVILANKLNIEIIADIDLFYCYLINYNKHNNTNKKLICITGTNGKSTTTALTAYLLNQFNLKSIACGNIGLNVLTLNIEKIDYFIVEMSSYNLYLMKYVIFDISILLNITEDHIFYHGNMENYVNAKEKAVLNSKQSIVCIDDDCTTKIVEKNTSSNITTIAIKHKNTDILSCDYFFNQNSFFKNNNMIYSGIFFNLPGNHNIQNIFCSVVCCFNILTYKNKDIKIADIFEKVKTFKGLKHRIQFVDNIDGVDFYNDSKGTNADSTQKALQSFQDRPIYLIAGGQRKTAGFLFLKNDLKNVRCVFLIGEAENSFANELNQMNIDYVKCDIMKKAMINAFTMAKKDNLLQPVILLSPLCASWDQYSNYEERGEDFIKIVDDFKQKNF